MMRLEIELFKTIIVDIEQSPFLENGNTKWFGFPVATNLNLFEGDIERQINDVTGYFLYIHYNEEEIIIANDITAGFRLYSYENDTTVILTDNYNKIVQHLKREDKLEIDELQFRFWEKHRYTVGDRTFVKELNKMPPHSLWEYRKNGIIKNSYFKHLERNPDSSVHKQKIAESLKNTFSALAMSDPKSEVVLLFSGGKDSRYLASLLQNAGIAFRPVFFYSEKSYKENYYDLLKARNGAELIGVDLLEIGVKIEEVEKMLPQITDELLFDRHFALLHYGGFEKLRKYFDENTVIINGQASDSIFSFGPSDVTIGSLIRRIIIYSPGSLQSRILKVIMERRLKQKFKIPKNQKERLRAFADEKNYIFLLNDDSDEYNQMLDQYIDKLTRGFEIDAQLMLIKINTFLQGSDNQVAIKSATHFNYRKVLLPFAAPEIIYNTIKYKSKVHEIFFPKYVVKNNTGSVNKSKDKKVKVSFDMNLKEIEELTLQNFKITAESIFK